jgi:hypothetical protein
LGRRRRVILPRRPGVWCCGGAGVVVHPEWRTPCWQPRARVQPLRFFIWFSRFAWPACAIPAQCALSSRRGAGRKGSAAVGQAAPRHFAASPRRVVLRRCGDPSAPRLQDPILAAQGSSATLKVIHLVFAFRMASVRYPRTASVVQPQWGRPPGRSSWAGGAASFCRVGRACGAAAVWGS